ncbi:1,4-dihydroxy-2-naphthoate octaprenyltransferase [Psychroflexus gondwanensis]|jgi:1,4-dihydroxy-2-naphthoate octaprenyltransferase|uniref:1,4-dihydroxy-2-naphthoate octaprenyltransferase n=1 Tax=Psychroflexus gondwanensis ACAM 44 TaxID=1189619 RepID=N1WSY4_9FLAO|nr:1,4-dihydroxy-2-naphthoate octaprenyltransferase [Psychroflexus gondwanensis]EMY80332.1 1,4-dihydroxy-2-naphthoate octaprenyltransferase MenA [Psychroflexus gondwanensis ACAM 44]TXE18722.1 1,4-dihydroxy-2-naphthoate octaprenyltransferase [Psychroflexus gondwanensis]
MSKTAAWISAARLRTLPLSISGILVGTALALPSNQFDVSIFWLAIATTLGLQILSNFANDYGDGVKGTDNDERIGPMRALQSGVISGKEMKKGIILTSIVTAILALSLIYISFGKENFFLSLLFIGLGASAIIAAIKYTVGDSAYGYKGLGDIFVFLFFGIMSVLGSNFLMTKQLDVWLFLPAISIGLLSSAVLNLNNMRDELSDRNSKKMTLVVKGGKKFAKPYHFSLILLAFICMVIFLNLDTYSSYNWILLPLLAFIPLAIHLRKIYHYTDPKTLDPELKKVALSTFALGFILFWIVFLEF